MRTLLVLALVAVIAGGASAEFYEGGVLGLYFSDTDFTPLETNYITSSAPFNGYIVLQDSPVVTVGGYEVGVSFSDAMVFVLSASGPNGWTNFGSNTNHLCGYQVPLPVDGSGNVVLGTLQMLYTAGLEVYIDFGPANPSSFDDVFNPAGGGIADGATPDNLYHCALSTGDVVGTVATLNVVLATESRTLTGVKALFE